MIESSRLNYIRHNHDQLRVVMYKDIHDKIIEGDKVARSMGMRIIRSGSSVGRPEIYVQQLFGCITNI